MSKRTRAEHDQEDAQGTEEGTAAASPAASSAALGDSSVKPESVDQGDDAEAEGPRAHDYLLYDLSKSFPEALRDYTTAVHCRSLLRDDKWADIVRVLRDVNTADRSWPKYNSNYRLHAINGRYTLFLRNSKIGMAVKKKKLEAAAGLGAEGNGVAMTSPGERPLGERIVGERIVPCMSQVNEIIRAVHEQGDHHLSVGSTFTSIKQAFAGISRGFCDAFIRRCPNPDCKNRHWKQPKQPPPAQPPAVAPHLRLQLYCWPPSVRAGESVQIHARWTDGPIPFSGLSLRVFRDGFRPTTVCKLQLSPSMLSVATKASTPANAAEVGCGWPEVSQIRPAAEWRSGMYLITLDDCADESAASTSGVASPSSSAFAAAATTSFNGTPPSESILAYFVVLPSPLARAPIVMVLSTATWAAYNDWCPTSGGGSEPRRNTCLYNGAKTVSLQRPLARGFLSKPPGARRKAQPRPDKEGQWYNDWARAVDVSVWSGSSGWATWERPFFVWAESQGYRIDVATSQDLHFRGSEILPPPPPPSIGERGAAAPPAAAPADGVRLMLSVGHDEYWSWGMRDSVEAFQNAGGNVAFFSGNTCFWQVRFERSAAAATNSASTAAPRSPAASASSKALSASDLHPTSLTCYKYSSDADPVAGTPLQHFLTGAWVDRRIGRPERTMTGLSFARGGYAKYGLGVASGSGAFSVHRPEHWAFEGTGLRYGDSLGLAAQVVAYEVDGCALDMVQGRPVARPEAGANSASVTASASASVPNLTVLATAPAKLWEQHEQPSRYADELGELEEMCKAIKGEGWGSLLAECGIL